MPLDLLRGFLGLLVAYVLLKSSPAIMITFSGCCSRIASATADRFPE
jgi:hypothetical protein